MRILKKVWTAALFALAIGGSVAAIHNAHAMRSGNPSGNATPVVDADDVFSLQCTPRTVTGNTTLVKADNKCGVLVTATATVTADTAANLGEGFEAMVWADGATGTISAGSTLAVTTGTFSIVRVVHAKRWVSALATPAIVN